MSITFSYGIDSIVLRNPELGNTEHVDIKTQFRRSMSGDMHSFIKTPESTTLTMSFSHILHSDVMDFISFLLLVAGEQISYTDSDGQDWTGYILTGPLDIVAQTRIGNVLESNSCKQDYSFTIDFEGTRDE